MSGGYLRGAAATLALLTVFALTGCGDDADQETAAGSSSADPVPEATPDTEEVVAEMTGGEECLYGNWYVENESFQTTLEEAGGTMLSVTGWAIVTYHPDGTSMSTFDEWTSVVTQDGVTSTMVRNGEDLATYEVSGDQITATETESNSVLEITMEMDGEDPMTMIPPHEESVVTTSTFTCEEENLTLVSDGVTSTMLREH